MGTDSRVEAIIGERHARVAKMIQPEEKANISANANIRVTSKKSETSRQKSSVHVLSCICPYGFRI